MSSLLLLPCPFYIPDRVACRLALWNFSTLRAAKLYSLTYSLTHALRNAKSGVSPTTSLLTEEIQRLSSRMSQISIAFSEFIDDDGDGDVSCVSAMAIVKTDLV